MDLIGRFTDIYVKSVIANGEGTGPDHQFHFGEMRKMMQRIKKHPSGQDALLVLLKHDSNWVKLWTSTELLVDGISGESILVIRELTKESGPIGFSAEVVLSEYENGTLKSPLCDFGDERQV